MFSKNELVNSRDGQDSGAVDKITDSFGQYVRIGSPYATTVIQQLVEHAKAKNQPRTIIVEGNIGSGKTTFLNYLKKFQSEMCLLEEPVQKWQNFNGTNLLGEFYRNPKENAMIFQTYVLLTMLEHHSQETLQPIKVMERSVFSSRRCFIENMRRNGTISKSAYDVLNKLYDRCSSNVKCDLFVYLRTSPKVVHARMLKRGRDEEKTVELKYLEDLNQLLEDWLLPNAIDSNDKSVRAASATTAGSYSYSAAAATTRSNRSKVAANVVVLNGDLDESEIVEEYERVAQKILSM